MGYVHSIESMGLVDGPGVRSVVFLQGCALRCLYCHNPDTWSLQGDEMSADALVKRLLRFRPYYTTSGGGVTFSGGEPLLQPDFLLDCLQQLKAQGIHTCIDTAGIGMGDYEALLQYTDLVLLDVKHPHPQGYQALTGRDFEASLPFIEALRNTTVPIWVRHVVIPGYTDSPPHMLDLKAYVETLPNVNRVELLPYHGMGAAKYQALGLEPPLAQVPQMDKGRCADLQAYYFPTQKGCKPE